jgi:hypothetical protein
MKGIGWLFVFMRGADAKHGNGDIPGDPHDSPYASSDERLPAVQSTEEVSLLIALFQLLSSWEDETGLTQTGNQN